MCACSCVHDVCVRMRTAAQMCLLPIRDWFVYSFSALMAAYLYINKRSAYLLTSVPLEKSGSSRICNDEKESEKGSDRDRQTTDDDDDERIKRFAWSVCALNVENAEKIHKRMMPNRSQNQYKKNDFVFHWIA